MLDKKKIKELEQKLETISEEMEALEIEILAKLGLENPYLER